MGGLCPKCEANVTRVNLTEITASAFMGKQWRTVKYSCPHCNTILGVQIDPIAIKTDIVEAILHAFGKG
jgi:hypothetical protein